MEDRTELAAVIDLDDWARRDQLDERLGVLAAQIHALTAELVDTAAEFHDADGWQGGGYSSYAQWLSVRTKFTPADARRIATVAQRRDELPTLMTHARAGQLSLGVLEHASRIVHHDNEPAVAKIALSCTAAQARRVLNKYRDLTTRRDDDPTPDFPDFPDDQDCNTGDTGTDSGGAGEAQRPVIEPEYWWHTWTDDAGRGRIDAALDTITAALMRQAWDAARAAGEADPNNNTTNCDTDSGGAGHATGEPTNDHADTDEPTDDDMFDPDDVFDLEDRDALIAQANELWRLNPNEIATRLATTMIDHAHDTGLRAPGGEHFLVQISIDVATLARVLDITYDPALPVQLGQHCYDLTTGTQLDDHQLATVLCDASRQILVHHHGAPLWLSNETRNATRQQRRALRFRANGFGCEFPGCTQTRYLHAHHVHHHACGGCTNPANLVMLCGHHHRTLHNNHWNITTTGNQIFTFWDRWGHCLGSSTTATGRTAQPPGQQHLPHIDQPPDPPPHINTNTPKSETRGEHLTNYALDIYLTTLLTA